MTAETGRTALEELRSVARWRLAAPGLRDALCLVDDAIFDLPIGDDVTYSRGYSAGIAAARDSLRSAIAAALSDQP